ncbi:MAG: type II toxin-antitoxin system HicB family antitoxin [Deltaproteobacteria bacterium]|nr:type II toxin-antitoxin system HicB family antitoxin [Deltaproteobacteria bacterium]MBW2011664.1 type II toxin-antitoxin system HicB family antitoxin [Deltaproteobacteria bacterium]
MQFNAIIEKDNDGYFAYVPKLKGCVSHGDTIEEVLKNIKEAIELYIETLEAGQLNQFKEHNYIIAPVEVEVAHAC